MKYRPVRKRLQSRRQGILIKKKINKILIVSFLITVILSIIAYNILFSPFFQIKKVSVHGNKKIASRELNKIIYPKLVQNFIFFKTKSIFLVPLNKIKDSLLDNYPILANVELKRNWPDEIEVDISEREAKAIWCQEDSCFLIDKEGIIFEKAKIPLDRLVIKTQSDDKNVALGTKVLLPEELEQIISLAAALKKETKIDSLSAELFPERVNILTKEGWSIYFNFPIKDVDYQLTRLKVVLQEEIQAENRAKLEYIDLRFSKVYYRYKGEVG